MEGAVINPDEERRLLELFRIVPAGDRKFIVRFLDETVKAGHVEPKTRPAPTLRLVKSERTA